MNWKKDAAKFLSGLATNQIMTHGAFAIGGIQFTLFGIDYTPTLNTAAVVFWVIVLGCMIYYAWIKKNGVRTRTSGTTVD